MVNEISGIGSASVARGLVQAGTPESNRGREAGGQFTTATADDNQVATRHVGFSALATAKDEATRAAQSIREVNQALGQVEVQMERLAQRVQVVKNYPPFPPGNEQRLEYINSINGLRKQLEAMSVPPVQEGVVPVFYPRESDLPVLDPGSASDEDVAMFGARLDQAGAKLEAGFRKLAESAMVMNVGIGVADGLTKASEPEVKILGETASRQLGGVAQPISGQGMPIGYL